MNKKYQLYLANKCAYSRNHFEPLIGSMSGYLVPIVKIEDSKDIIKKYMKRYKLSGKQFIGGFILDEKYNLVCHYDYCGTITYPPGGNIINRWAKISEKSEYLRGEIKQRNKRKQSFIVATLNPYFESRDNLCNNVRINYYDCKYKVTSPVGRWMRKDGNWHSIHYRDLFKKYSLEQVFTPQVLSYGLSAEDWINMERIHKLLCVKEHPYKKYIAIGNLEKSADVDLSFFKSRYEHTKPKPKPKTRKFFESIFGENI